MLRKLLAVALSLVLCVVISGCDSNMEFDSLEDMKKYVKGVWRFGGVYIIINGDNIQRFDELAFVNSMNSLITTKSIDVDTLTFEEFFDDVLPVRSLGKVEYKYKSGEINLVDEQDRFRISDSGTMYFATEKKDYYMTHLSTNPNFLRELLEERFDSKIDKIRFERKCSTLPTAREVQYNKWGYTFKEFTISGSAELDDYYNWDYRNSSYTYFCIHITPTNGYYSDSWYVYARRDEFTKLYEKLQMNSSLSLTVIAKMTSPDTGSNNMATLVDYEK